MHGGVTKLSSKDKSAQIEFQDLNPDVPEGTTQVSLRTVRPLTKAQVFKFTLLDSNSVVVQQGEVSASAGISTVVLSGLSLPVD